MNFVGEGWREDGILMGSEGKKKFLTDFMTEEVNMCPLGKVEMERLKTQDNEVIIEEEGPRRSRRR